jgi:fructose-bisphosphate aldolase class 1
MTLNNLDTSLSEDTTHKEAKAKAFLNRLLLKNSYVVEIKIDKGWTTVLLTNF